MRFYKPGQTQYQSQFAPLDLNFIQKIGAAKDAESYAVDDMLDKADQLQIEAGMFSKKDEVDKYNQWLKSNIATTRDKLLNQEITEQEAARNISKINSVLANSDAVKFFNVDRELSKQIRANMAAGKYNQGISTNFNYLDPNNPQITPMSYTEGLDALARAGNIQVPGDFVKDHKEWYDNINTTQLEGVLKASGYNIINDSKIGPILVDGKGQKVTRGRFREALKPLAENYAKDNFANTSLGSVDYMRKTGKTQEDYTNRLLDSYSGYFKLDEDTRDYNYRPLGDGSGKNTKPEMPPRSVGVVGSTQDFGVSMPDMMDSWGIDALNNWKNKYKDNFDFTKIDVKGTPENDYFTKKQPSSRDVPFSSDSPMARAYQPNEIQDPQFKKLFTNFVSNSKKWDHNLAGVNGEFEIPQGTLLSMYGDFARNMSEFKKDVIKTGNTAQPITPANRPDIWADYVGVDEKSATVGNVLTQAINNGAAIYSQKDNKVLTPEETKALYDLEAKTPLSGIQEYTPENVLSFMTGDDNFTGGVGFATSDGKYIVNKVTSDYTESTINNLYKNGKLNTNQWLDLGVYNFKYKIDKNNKVHLKSSNNKELELNSITEALKVIKDAAR